MEYRRLGKSGLKVSALSLGSWLTFGKQIDDSVAEECMKQAYEHGVNFFDNAEIYARGESEMVMGRLLKKFGWRRDSFVVSSKVFWGVTNREWPTQWGLSRKHVVEACNQALKRLQVDYLDLYFCHRPDIETPIEETVWAMHNLIQQGKVLYWGTSEWSAQEIQQAIAVAEKNHLIAPVMEQPQYNMFYRTRFEVEYHRLFQDYGYGTTIWSPLASGLLTGKYNNGLVEGTRLSMEGMDWLKDKTLLSDRIEKVRKLTKLAKEMGTEMPELALAWCLKNPNVSTAIMGASKVEQLKQNLQAVKIVDLLTNEVIAKIEVILNNKKDPPVY